MGIVAAVAGSLALTGLVSRYLFEVTPTDPVTFIEVSLLLTAIALFASWLPARRAAKVDPMVALRCE